jgi:hypothetical protein
LPIVLMLILFICSFYWLILVPTAYRIPWSLNGYKEFGRFSQIAKQPE